MTDPQPGMTPHEFLSLLYERARAAGPAPPDGINNWWHTHVGAQLALAYFGHLDDAAIRMWEERTQELAAKLRRDAEN